VNLFIKHKKESTTKYMAFCVERERERERARARERERERERKGDCAELLKKFSKYICGINT